MKRLAYGNLDQWHAHRRTGIGASEAAQCLGLLPSPLAVYNRKLGLEPPGPPTIPQRVGLSLEPLIALLYAEETGRPINETQILVRSDDHPFMLATIDGLDCEGDIVEFKTITPRRLRELGDTDLEQVPDEWNCQVQHQMIVAEKHTATIAVLVGNEDFRLYPVRRNAALCEMIVEAETDLFERIGRRAPPPAMEGDIAGDIMRAYAGTIESKPTDDDVERIMARIVALTKLKGHVEKMQEAEKARLAEWMGNAVAAQSEAGWKAVRKRVNRKGYVVEPTSYETLTVTPPKGFDHARAVEGASQKALARIEGVFTGGEEPNGDD